MLISATADSKFQRHQVTLTTSGRSHTVVSCRCPSEAPEASICELITHTDKVAEIQNTLRLGLPVTLESFLAVSTDAA